MRRQDLLQRCRQLPESPAAQDSFLISFSLLQQRSLSDAFGASMAVIGVSSLVADPVAVDRLVVSGFQPMHALVVIAGIEALVEMNFDVAAAAASGTDRRRAAQEPDAAFKAEIPVGQRPDGTNVRDIAGIGIVSSNPGITSISLRCPRSDDPQFRGFGDLARKTHAAGAEDAALLIQNDVRPDGSGFLPLGLVFVEARIVKPVLHVVVLELAFARLIADRAIQRMIGQQKFQHRTPVPQSLRRPACAPPSLRRPAWRRKAAVWDSFRFPPGTSGSCRRPEARDDSNSAGFESRPFWPLR